MLMLMVGVGSPTAVPITRVVWSTLFIYRPYRLLPSISGPDPAYRMISKGKLREKEPDLTVSGVKQG